MGGFPQARWVPSQDCGKMVMIGHFPVILVQISNSLNTSQIGSLEPTESFAGFLPKQGCQQQKKPLPRKFPKQLFCCFYKHCQRHNGPRVLSPYYGLHNSNHPNSRSMLSQHCWHGLLSLTIPLFLVIRFIFQFTSKIPTILLWPQATAACIYVIEHE